MEDGRDGSLQLISVQIIFDIQGWVMCFWREFGWFQCFGYSVLMPFHYSFNVEIKIGDGYCNLFLWNFFNILR